MLVEIAAFNPIGDHAGTAVSGTATLTKASGAKDLLIQCVSGTARWNYGTANPGTATGFQIRGGDPAVLVPLSFGTAIKVCPESGTVSIQYQWGG